MRRDYMALTHVVDRYVILSVGTCAIHTAMGIQIFWAIINITSKQVAKIHQSVRVVLLIRCIIYFPRGDRHQRRIDGIYLPV